MATATRELRIGTWNLHESVPANDNLGAADAARREITALLVRHRLDVVGLQEVDFPTSASSPTLDAIASATPLKHIAYSVLSGSVFYPEGGAAVAIASRFPLENVVRRFFENPGLYMELDGARERIFDKGYLTAGLIIGGREVSVVSLHAFPFHLFGRRAEEPVFGGIWSSLSAELTTMSSAPLIVCGDFNTSRRDLLAQDGRPVPLSRAITTQPTCYDQCVDDMLLSRHFGLGEVTVVDNFSDHRLCLADVVLRDPR